MANIKDVAKKAGVSTTAVSYALNGSDKVSEKTRNKIKDIAKELDYTPNIVGKSLQQKKTKLIAVFLTDYSGSFYGRVLAGIKRRLEKNGYELIVCSGEKAYSFLPQKLVDGAIILDTSFPDEMLLHYANMDCKLVVLERELKHENISSVLIDDAYGAKLATDELIAQNIKYLIILDGPHQSFSGHIRKKVALELARKQQLEVEILSGNFNVEAGVKHGKYIYELAQHKRIGVFCLNDNMALGLYLYFRDIPDFTIGKDIQIVGFDAALEGQLVSPTLTTIYFSQTKWGQLAAENLLAMLKGQKSNDQILKTTLLQGSSTGQK